jgi:hypothetical protein
MPLTFASKAKKATANDDTPPFETKTHETKSTSKPSVSWMKRGVKAKQMLDAADAQAEKAKESVGKLFRFWIPPEEERLITFLDGELDDTGMLDVPMFYEHRVKINGAWDTFVCVADEEPCPICENSDSRQTMVGVMTVIDHTEYKIQRGPNAGKVVKNTRKLFVATRNTLKTLAKQAVKRDGLTGCTFEVSRTGDKEPGVGGQFEFVEKRSLAQVAKAFDLKPEDLKPADYDYEVIRRTADQLIELGLGKPPSGVGYEKASVSGKAFKSQL